MAGLLSPQTHNLPKIYRQSQTGKPYLSIQVLQAPVHPVKCPHTGQQLHKRLSSVQMRHLEPNSPDRDLSPLSPVTPTPAIKPTAPGALALGGSALQLFGLIGVSAAWHCVVWCFRYF